MPANWCPFCPGSGRVPADYDVLLYPNDFPAFSPDAPPFDPVVRPFSTTGARGACDVVLYSPKHTLPPSQLTPEQWRKVIELWRRRTAELAAMPDVRYVMPFENTGEAIGVTMPHPHGQIYAFPFYPPLVEKELDAARRFQEREGECLYCTLLRRELEDGARVVASNESFVAFVSFAARFPFELQIYARRHFGSLTDMTDQEVAELAGLLSTVRKKYDNLPFRRLTSGVPYGESAGDTSDPFLMPLMMIVRTAPVRGHHRYFHFHIEFLPLQRSEKKLKYLASVETAGGTYLADTRPEDTAAKLRDTEPR